MPATVARSNVMAYNLAGRGSVRMYTPPEVIEDALPSLLDAPVTLKHPPQFVDASSHEKYSRGHVRADAAFDGEYLRSTLVVQGADLIQAIDAGMREVSAGYRYWADFTPGVTPKGEAYDAIRTKVEYNHVAVVPAGRAGHTVCLALDSSEIPSMDEVAVKISGQEVAADKAQAAVDALEAKLAATEARIAELQTKLTVAEGKASDAAIDAAVEAKLAAKAAKAECDAKREKLKAAGVSCDGRDDSFVSAAFDTLEALRKADPEGTRAAVEREAPATQANDKVEKGDKAKKLPPAERRAAERARLNEALAAGKLAG